MPAHMHPTRFWFACWLDISWNIVSPGSMSRHESTRCPPCTESPFAPSGCYPSLGVASPATWKGITLSSSLIRAHAPDQLPPTHFGLGLAQWVLAGCCQPLLGDGPSRRYLRKSFPRCLDPYPGGTLWCVRPFLPIEHRPSPHNYWVGSHNEPYSDFTTGVYFGAAVIPSCSGPQVCSPPRSLLPQSLDEAGQP